MNSSLHKLFGIEDRGAPPLILAPMAGYTDAAMRRACRRHGAALAYTEMASAAGLLHADRKTWQMLETLPDEGPVAAHLYGSEPDQMAEAASRVAQTGRFAAIDLNAGCPVRKITACGAGAALIHDPQRIHDILCAMRRVTDLPLTIKTRLGPSPDRVMIFDILDAAESAGADAVALHARFTSQGHGGATNLELLAEVKRRARIPVIGNGGIRDARDARRMLDATGVDAVMIARGAIGNPWIFADLSAALVRGAATPEDVSGRTPLRGLDEIREALEAHMAASRELFDQMNALFGIESTAARTEEHLVAAFRAHLFRYLRGLKGSSYLRGRLHLLHTPADIRAAVAACLERENEFRRR
ncbi:MAG: tRNA-dihydrouridine synthase family protein [Kiritimatiellae bacterium]|nr:tRNA-dihydrouridine synthase family protein [Kiritimatiellia bacterium]